MTLLKIDPQSKLPMAGTLHEATEYFADHDQGNSLLCYWGSTRRIAKNREQAAEFFQNAVAAGPHGTAIDDSKPTETPGEHMVDLAVPEASRSETVELEVGEERKPMRFTERPSTATVAPPRDDEFVGPSDDRIRLYEIPPRAGAQAIIFARGHVEPAAFAAAINDAYGRVHRVTYNAKKIMAQTRCESWYVRGLLTDPKLSSSQWPNPPVPAARLPEPHQEANPAVVIVTCIDSQYLVAENEIAERLEVIGAQLEGMYKLLERAGISPGAPARHPPTPIVMSDPIVDMDADVDAGGTYDQLLGYCQELLRSIQRRQQSLKHAVEKATVLATAPREARHIGRWPKPVEELGAKIKEVADSVQLPKLGTPADETKAPNSP